MSAFNDLVSGLGANGTRDADAFGYGTDIYDAIRVAREELTGTALTTDADGSGTYGPLDPSGNDRNDAAKVLVLLSNGGYGNDENPRDPVPAADAARAAGIEIYSIAYGSDSNDALLGAVADDADHFFDVEDYDNIVPTFEEIADLITGEKIFAQGTLREVLEALGDGVALDGDRIEDGRQCYPNSTTQYFGFEWWLPIEVGNEVQSDSVEFDLRFYAEQCRHNDGATNPFEEVA
ncbi:VWA domain-containing protein [Halobacteriaceae archaeon GCM10025711]